MNIIIIFLVIALLYSNKVFILSYFNGSNYRSDIPVTHQIGVVFEYFVETEIFPDTHYAMVEKTHDFLQNNYRYVESSLNPDFRFRSRKTNFDFYIEAKFRSSLDSNGMLDWCKNIAQFNRYKYVNQYTPVFIMIGLGGSPHNPDHLYLLPLDKIKYISLYPSQFQKFSYEIIYNTLLS